jgi:hypothetical protein
MSDRLTRERDGWKDACERATKEMEYWRERAVALGAAADREVWYWRGDGEDYPGSLTGHVVMSASQLRDLLARAEGAKS